MERIQPHPNTLQVCVTLVKPPPPLDVKKGGDEWKLFKQMWSNYCINTRLNDEEEACKRALFLHTLGKEGLALYNRMQLPADDFVDNIITAFDNHFLGRTSETYLRYVFNKRDQKANESIENYVSALHSLASTCNFCDCLKDSLLRDRIVLGIKDSSTRKRLLQETDLNLETCIAMCHAAEATSPSQPVETVTWTEDTTAVQTGSVSPGGQRPDKKQEFSMSLSHCDDTASPDEVEMSEANFSTELDDSEDSALQWTTEHQSSGFLKDRTEHNNKLEPASSIEEDSLCQPPAVYSTVQPMSENSSKSKPSLNTSHVCHHCSAAFVLVSCLKLHLASVHGEKLHMVLPGSSTPDICDAGKYRNTDIVKEADNLGNRKEPMINKVDGSDAGDKDGKKKSRQYVCDVCRKSFYDSSTLRRHKLIHSGVKSFACDVCSKSFILASYLREHKRIHIGERPFKCPHCDSEFKQSGNVQRHIKSVHEGARPHLCDGCGAAFPTNYDLRVHKIKHTGEYPHVCSDCGKGFALSNSLKTHRLTHSGQKPYVCSDCGKGFTQAGNLAQHRLIHTGVKPHVCSDCGRGFTRSNLLKRHRLTHSGKKPGTEATSPSQPVKTAVSLLSLNTSHVC